MENYDAMTLRDRLTLAERRIRELRDHLERGFLPKVSDTVELIHPSRNGVFPETVKDVTLRNSVKNLLAADEFTNQSAEKLVALCTSVEEEIDRILENK
ncbi:hypothetical protein Pla110_37640 [Polystyrenella longa]|uniref:Uncharacterized protein n=1 Tax=Polystyrenella longa TaxID=2528007 RepID=A0A518CS06_9PLAN|nr:hypothetical protein [Polystyrenella longa]QDU82012.1 hypothetical protein Pla110_37640 [Polystyrenella longa]